MDFVERSSYGVKMGLDDFISGFKINLKLTWRQIQYSHYDKIKHPFYKDEQNYTRTANH